MNEFINILIYGVAVAILIATVIILSYILGEHHRAPATGEQYESGIASTGNTKLRFSEHYYIVAMFFVIFDLETVFLVSWAVAFKDAGWAGYAGMLVFLAFLISVFVYEWRIGALNFETSGKAILKALQRIKK